MMTTSLGMRTAQLLLLFLPTLPHGALLQQHHSARTITTRTSTIQQHASATPIDAAGWPDRFPAKQHCSKCGLCETSLVSQVVDACAFLEQGMSRMDVLEFQVHGRERNLQDMVWDGTTTETNTAEEARFGVLHQPVMLAKGIEKKAQWTGCVTGIALSMLEAEMVDAVVCIANAEKGESSSSWSSPEPILAKSAKDVLRGRGVKPALAPSLKVLDDVKNDESISKLLFCGVGCAVQAFRAVQDDLGLEEIYVLGTNCADNSPTPEAAQDFIRNGVKLPQSDILGYEFMQDFKVHVKTSGGYVTKPYFCLPGTIAAASIAPSCLACFDYTNGLADVVVGYMGAPLNNKRMDESYQTVTIRNERGKQMVDTAVQLSRLQIAKVATGTGSSHEKFASATVKSDSIVMAMMDKEIPQNGMPRIVGEIMAFAMRNVGPKGINFARYSIDYHVLRNYLHVVAEWGEERAYQRLPQYAKDIVSHYLQTEKTMTEITDEIRKSKQSR